MNRRALIKSASAALLGFGFDGCATSRIARKSSTFPADALSPLKLSLVEASWDRVIRTTVGLRPHRDSHRAIDLSRCARSRLPLFWRPDHYSKVRYTPRFHVPAATDHH